MSNHVLLAATLVLSLGSAARAGTLVAGPLTIFNDGQTRCMAVNVSGKPLDVTLTLLGFGGAEKGSHTCLGVAPGAGCVKDAAGNEQGNSCRIDVRGSKNGVRGVLEVYRDAGFAATHASSPAR